MNVAIKVQALLGERHCGDMGLYREFNNGSLLAILVDVTGHGDEAGRLAKKIESRLVFQEDQEVESYLDVVNEICRGEIGCAAGVVKISTDNRFTYAGVGNVLCHIYRNNESKSLVSKDGMLGVRKGSYFKQEYQLEPKNLVLMHTDGLSDFSKKELFFLEHENINSIVHRLVRDCGKMTDDMGCLGIKI
ncbi:Indirect negative regulation of sigma B dependant gene expression (serine phosphatase) [Lentisphaera araneosa HTCC2155]|jgi:serine phosphatase RsbU (regulator of sigma subunit)|uniref:Indirect negative regulation of sigma B dependant gene expression (Serine phosphatase) n=1 Tax=Lentisphaera araneosa HTCC2155 TaxID=313628 RepID=A6DPS1_9BACT|nr:SpoIIE family protein phosphatase [Lentisphaera araneosa]EDM26366.1 Indirect negative regulation of sigma B dependant gene expression (serine phosphatase) [Lentisphaera araneosa HTCC2155]